MKTRLLRSLDALAGLLLPGGGGLPGAADVGAADALARRMHAWQPSTAAGVRWLVRMWEYLPVASHHLRPFSALSPADRAAWVAGCERSRFVGKRQLLQVLKQLIFLTWAADPKAEAALGYDETCYGDDETNRSQVPKDYIRPGPAVASGAVPLRLLERTDFVERDPALTCIGFPDVPDGESLRCDAVVIGSGAGGAVVAAGLADAGLDVIVLEEGPHVTQSDFHGAPLDRLQRFCRDDGTTLIVGRPPIPLPIGRVVGGTTVVNSGTCFRAPERVLRRWESEYGVEGATPEGLAPYYDDLEDFLNVRPVPWELLGANGTAAHRGATALGMTGGPLLRNITGCHGCGQCILGCPTNAKQAMHISYLPRAQRAGARVVERCRVDRIDHENGRARGVVATLLDNSDRRSGRLRVEADHVLVCAGAVHTPVLLTRSHVPDPSGWTGRNLSIHPATGVVGVFDEVMDNWRGTLQSYYIDALLESHEIMFEATSTIPGIGVGSVPGIAADAMAQLADFRHTAMLGFYVSDTSTGRVHALPKAGPVITYRMNALDAHRAGYGLATAAEVLLAAGARSVHVGLPHPASVSSRADIESLRKLAVHPRHLRLTAFHPMGTARMGADPATSVVDEWGRHHQVENLWVADASTFPTCVGVNPQMTIMALAQRTAERLVKGSPRPN